LIDKYSEKKKRCVVAVKYVSKHVSAKMLALMQECGDYLEFEIYGDRIEVFKITGGKDEEFNISITEDLNNIINEFMKIS